MTKKDERTGDQVVAVDGEELHLFWGGPLSQWYPSDFRLHGVTYTCAEQWMMATKARVFKDDDALEHILDTPYPKTMKEWGRRVRGFDAAEWDRISRDVVYRGNMEKFTQCKGPRAALLATRGTIAEASPYDAIWGIGLGQDDPRALSRLNWGRNWLGEVLTAVRLACVLAEDEAEEDKIRP